PQQKAPDAISIAYAAPVADEQVRKDFQVITTELHKAPVQPRVQRRAPQPGMPETTSGDAQIPGLVDWSKGTIFLDPVIKALARYHHVKADYLFFGKFDLTWPV